MELLHFFKLLKNNSKNHKELEKTYYQFKIFSIIIFIIFLVCLPLLIFSILKKYLININMKILAGFFVLFAGLITQFLYNLYDPINKSEENFDLYKEDENLLQKQKIIAVELFGTFFILAFLFLIAMLYIK